MKRYIGSTKSKFSYLNQKDAKQRPLSIYNITKNVAHDKKMNYARNERQKFYKLKK